MTKETTDFSKILTELKELGVNDYEMERRTSIARSTFSRLRTGSRKQPNYDDGVEIMRVYTEAKSDHTNNSAVT